jgi:hypothetical protein
MRLIHVFFFLILSHAVSAQLTIVRDPISCTYGLKDQEKNWVVKPQFQDIQAQQNGLFSFKEGEQWGVLKKTGKILIQARFDQISMITPALFLVTNQKKEHHYNYSVMGVIDTSNAWLFPQEYSSIKPLSGGRFLLVKSSYSKQVAPQNESTIADAKGKLLFPFIPGVILYTHQEKPVYLVGDQLSGTFSVSGNVRFISNNGKNISDSTFDKGQPCGENFTIVKNNKFGLFDASGKAIVWPRFEFERNIYDPQNSLPCLHSHHQFIFNENGKQGVVDGNWKVIVSPTYKSIVPVNSQAHISSPARYFGHNSEKKSYDLIDLKGKVLYEADTFSTRIIRIPSKNYYAQDANRVFFFFGKRHGKDLLWGILNEKGEVLTPATNENIIITSELEALFIERGKDNIPYVNRSLLSESESLQKKPASFKIKMDSIYLFQHEDQFYPLIYDGTEGVWLQQLYGYSLPKSYGNLLLISGGRGGFIYDMKKNSYEKVRSIDLFNGGMPLIHSSEGVNIVHPDKGILFKEYHLQINQQFKSQNRIWVQKQTGKWQLYDSVGKLRIEAEFDAVSYDWESMIVQQNLRKGIIDDNCKWIIKPVFSDLFPFTKTLYVGITQSKKVAVVNLNDPSKIDTSYSSFIPLYIASDGSKVFYTLEKNGKSTCFDKEGNQVSLTKKEIYTQFWTDPLNYNFFRIQCLYEQKTDIDRHKDLIYDHLFPIYSNAILQNKGAVINGERGTNYEVKKQFKIEHASIGSLSISISEPNMIQLDMDWHSEPNSYFEVTNWVFLKDGSTKKVVFSDLFNANNPIYQKAIIETIQDFPDLRIDCSNPEYLFEGKKQISLQKEGVKIYFSGNNAQTFELILSKERIARINSAKWILEYL